MNSSTSDKSGADRGDADTAAPASALRPIAEDQASPRTVIRGERSGEDPTSATCDRYEIRARGIRRAKIVAIPIPKHDGEPFAAITDYLNCTFPIGSAPSDLRRAFDLLLPVLGEMFSPISDRGRGLHGYHQSFEFGRSKALFAVGGQRDTAFLSLPGEACTLVRDWADFGNLLAKDLRARITRWDGAVDDYNGVRSVDWAVEQYKAGGFNAGGTKPSCHVAGEWVEQTGRGRTFYVGARRNGKLARIYEKGMQLMRPWDPWVRFEVEWHNKDREIPWDVLQRPGCYVAGSYPCMAWVQEEMSRIKTAQKTGQISYDHLTKYARIAYGRLLNVMMDVEGDATAVVERLRRFGVPARLDIPLPPESCSEE